MPRPRLSFQACRPRPSSLIRIHSSPDATAAVTWKLAAIAVAVGMDDRVGECLRDGQADLVEPLAAGAGGNRHVGQGPDEPAARPPERPGMTRSGLRRGSCRSIGYPHEGQVIRRKSHRPGRRNSRRNRTPADRSAARGVSRSRGVVERGGQAAPRRPGQRMLHAELVEHADYDPPYVVAGAVGASAARRAAGRDRARGSPASSAANASLRSGTERLRSRCCAADSSADPRRQSVGGEASRHPGEHGQRLVELAAFLQDPGQGDRGVRSGGLELVGASQRGLVALLHQRRRPRRAAASRGTAPPRQAAGRRRTPPRPGRPGTPSPPGCPGSGTPGPDRGSRRRRP